MDSLIETFHIDVKMLLAQTVNFAVVVGVLYFLVFKPLLRVMREREKKIKDGLRFADQAERDLRSAGEKSNQIVAEARRRADAEMEKAKQAAEDRKKETLEKARAEAEAMIVQARSLGEEERRRIVEHSKKDVLDLAFAAAAAALGKKIGDKEDKKLTEQIIKNI